MVCVQNLVVWNFFNGRNFKWQRTGRVVDIPPIDGAVELNEFEPGTGEVESVILRIWSSAIVRDEACRRRSELDGVIVVERSDGDSLSLLSQSHKRL